jgi:hypothetical protein
MKEGWMHSRQEASLNTIAYLVYGAQREYQLELTYSVLSAVHRLGSDGSKCRIALIADEENQRPDLPVEHVVYSPAEFSSWTRNGQYKHEAKVHGLLKALDRFKGKVALVDTDTYFNVSPLRLFEHIGPGQSVMHVFERLLSDDEYLGPILEKIGNLPLSYSVSRETRLFNSGVIGLDFSARHLVEDVIALTAQLYSVYSAFNIEQLAFSIVLGKQTSLADCPGFIRHYYGYERGFIHAQIAELFPEFSVELFHRHIRALPKIGGYPKKRKLDLIKARLMAIVRRESDEYRFAYLAYLSALSSAKNSPLKANIWARIAVAVLRQCEFVIADAEQDFRAMKCLEPFTWLNDDTKRAWTALWKEAADARERGQLRATATAYLV